MSRESKTEIFEARVLGVSPPVLKQIISDQLFSRLSLEAIGDWEDALNKNHSTNEKTENRLRINRNDEDDLGLEREARKKINVLYQQKNIGELGSNNAADLARLLREGHRYKIDVSKNTLSVIFITITFNISDQPQIETEDESARIPDPRPINKVTEDSAKSVTPIPSEKQPQSDDQKQVAITPQKKSIYPPTFRQKPKHIIGTTDTVWQNISARQDIKSKTTAEQIKAELSQRADSIRNEIGSTPKNSPELNDIRRDKTLNSNSSRVNQNTVAQGARRPADHKLMKSEPTQTTGGIGSFVLIVIFVCIALVVVSELVGNKKSQQSVPNIPIPKPPTETPTPPTEPPSPPPKSPEDNEKEALIRIKKKIQVTLDRYMGFKKLNRMPITMVITFDSRGDLADYIIQEEDAFNSNDLEKTLKGLRFRAHPFKPGQSRHLKLIGPKKPKKRPKLPPDGIGDSESPPKVPTKPGDAINEDPPIYDYDFELLDVLSVKISKVLKHLTMVVSTNWERWDLPPTVSIASEDEFNANLIAYDEYFIRSLSANFDKSNGTIIIKSKTAPPRGTVNILLKIVTMRSTEYEPVHVKFR